MHSKGLALGRLFSSLDTYPQAALRVRKPLICNICLFPLFKYSYVADFKLLTCVCTECGVERDAYNPLSETHGAYSSTKLTPSLGAALWFLLSGGQSQQAPVCFHSSFGTSVIKTALLSFSFPRLEGYNSGNKSRCTGPAHIFIGWLLYSFFPRTRAP